MPYEWVESEVFMTYRGIEIYHIYKNDFTDSGVRDCWYSLNSAGSDNDPHGENGTFDHRELSTPPCGGDGIPWVIKSAIDRGEPQQLLGEMWFDDLEPTQEENEE